MIDFPFRTMVNHNYVYKFELVERYNQYLNEVENRNEKYVHPNGTAKPVSERIYQYLLYLMI